MGRIALLLLLAVSPALAESTVAFQPKRFRSPSGAHYLDAKEAKGGRCAFELGEKGRRIASGVLEQLPLDAQVLDKRPAAVLFERYGEIGKGLTLALLERDGKLRWSLKLGDLFNREAIARFPTSMTSIWWHRAWWVDEERGRIVLAAKGGLLREVDLETGEVAEAEKNVVLTGIPRPAALELAAEYELEGVRPLAEPLVADASQPLAVRLRAAIAVQGAGGPRAPKALFEQALDLKQAPAERRYAVQQAPRVLGPDSVDLLEGAAARNDTAYDALRAMGELGETGAFALASVMADGATTPAVRSYAAGVLAKLPGRAVSRAIFKELEGADAQVAGALLRAGIAAGVPQLHRVVMPHEESLLRALRRNTAPVDWLADHFKLHPSTEAVRPLLDALGRHAGNPVSKRKLIEALRACTGLDFGNDPAAWRRGLR
jgi:hypothetical protein